eukprot:Clim_evm38s136 gene=Clim_evmTU38s136
MVQAHAAGLPQLSKDQQERLASARAFAGQLTEKLKNVQDGDDPAVLEAKVLQDHCQIYCGNVPADLDEAKFLHTLTERFGPVINVKRPRSQQQNFAFLTFETPEAASQARSLGHGMSVQGRNIRIDFPSTLHPRHHELIKALEQRAKDECRIFISGVHEALTEEDLQSVFDAFGEISAFEMPKKNGGHCGYMYISFVEATAADDAVKAMHGFDLGGNKITVIPAIAPRGVILQNLSQRRTKLSFNCAIWWGPEDADDELREDVEEECSTFGTVKDVSVTVTDDSQVLVTVVFAERSAADAAIAKLNGRLFDGRRVDAVLIS